MSSLTAFAKFVDTANERIGRAVAWAALLMVLAQFSVVVMRYIFGVGSIMLQESVIYLHATLFMVGAAYTLLHDGHVRVDVFYREATPRNKAWVNLFGALFFMLPVCVLIWWASWPYVLSAWAVFEGSKETSGIQGVFLLKSVVLAFSFLMTLQTLSMAARSALVVFNILPAKPESD